MSKGPFSLNLSNKRILIIKQSSLGDIIHTLPVAHCLKRCAPTCQIGWVVEQGFAPLLERDTAIDRVYPIHIPSTSSPDASRGVYFRALSATVHAFRILRAAFAQQPYDLLLDLHASFRSGLIALANPGGLRIGFAGSRECNGFFQHQHIKVPSLVEHALEKNLLFLDFLGCAACKEDYYLCSNEEDQQQAQAFLQENGLKPNGVFVYVNPAARWQSKFWLQERWAELCERLLIAGIPVIFGGSVGERAYIQGIIDQIPAGLPTPPAVAAGRLSLTASIALMQKASLYIGLDTGPMHMAAMAGIPVVALFGPTHPERVGPYGVPHVVLRGQGLDCLCCRKRVCDKMDCMQGISVEDVWQAAHTLCPF